MTGLTGKQSAFVTAYLGEAHYNASLAAKIAGYSGGPSQKGFWSQGCLTLKIPKVKAAIAAQKALKSGENPLQVSDVLADLQWCLETAREKKDLGSFLRAAELLGRYLAMFTDKSQVEDVTQVKQLDERKAEEARRIVAIRLREVA